jgi:hypothetical protein
MVVKCGAARYRRLRYFVIRDLKTELLKADLVKKWTLPLGSQELRLYVLSRGQRHLEEISVRFQKYASRSDMPDNVHPDIIRVTGVSDYYIETAEWQGSVAKSEADPRGGWRLVYDRPITWPKGKPLPLRVQVLAQQRWSGYISLQDRRTYDTVRLPVKIE